MRRGTTPTITVEVDADLTGLQIYLAFKCGSKLVVKTDDDLNATYEEDKTTIECILSQRDTLAFKSGGVCEVQIRAVDASGYPALATTIGSIPVERILQEGVLNA